jgi:hypothetical protein
VPASFGDNVRIVPTPVTEEAGVAGLIGNVFGETKPSVSGVSVIGTVTDDFALNVFFEQRKEALWFSRDLVELLDHAPGSTIRLDGVEKQWVREESGAWREVDRPSPSLWQRLVTRLRGHG